MCDDYVRKDVVDEMRRTFEAQLAACVAEYKAETAAIRGEVETLRSLVVVLDDQASRKKSTVMAFIGAVLAGAAAVLAAVQVFIALFGTGGVR